MNITCTFTHLALLCITLQSMQPLHANWFSPKHEQEELLELAPKQKLSSLSIEHELQGTIHIKGWHQAHIAVTIHKKAHAPEDLARAYCTLTQTEHGIISLRVQASENMHKKCTVDLTIHMPYSMPTTVMAQSTIFAEHMHNTIQIQTNEGDIFTEATRGMVHGETKKGTIVISDAFGPVTAYTEHGNIAIEASHNSVTAETMQGSITASCAALPTTASLTLTSNKRGTLLLTLPETVEARLIADTCRGTITSDLLITLERHTTLLNSHAYKDAQQHIRGVIGQNGAAEIRLAASGNIHLTPAE